MSLKGVTCLKIEESLDQAANRTTTLPRISNLDSQDLDVNNGVSIAKKILTLSPPLNLLYLVAHLIRESISDSMRRNKKRGRKSRRTGSLLSSKSNLKVTERLLETLYRFLKRKPFCTSMLCIKRNAISLVTLKTPLQEW